MTLQTVLDEIQERPGSGDVIPIVDPVTEEQITQFTDCGEKAVDDAVHVRRRRTRRAFGPTCRGVSGPRSFGASQI
jgi:hypothetical protein